MFLSENLLIEYYPVKQPIYIHTYLIYSLGDDSHYCCTFDLSLVFVNQHYCLRFHAKIHTHVISHCNPAVRITV